MKLKHADEYNHGLIYSGVEVILDAVKQIDEVTRKEYKLYGDAEYVDEEITPELIEHYIKVNGEYFLMALFPPFPDELIETATVQWRFYNIPNYTPNVRPNNDEIKLIKVGSSKVAIFDDDKECLKKVRKEMSGVL